LFPWPAPGRLKRGGGVLILDLDRAGLPLKDAIAAERSADPVGEFERAWRNEVVARAMERVRDRLKVDGRETQFQVFEAYDLAAPPVPLPPESQPDRAREQRRTAIRRMSVSLGMDPSELFGSPGENDTKGADFLRRNDLSDRYMLDSLALPS
jgi:hypothetical protein